MVLVGHHGLPIGNAPPAQRGWERRFGLISIGYGRVWLTLWALELLRQRRRL
jgi:hypothetical protein